MSWDISLVIWLNNLATWPPLRQVALWVAVYGLLLYFVVALYYWYHPTNKSQKWAMQRVVVLGVLGVMTAIVFEQLISVFIFRERPFAVIDQLTAYNVFVDSSSFPSLHTAMSVAFAGAWLWSGHKKIGWLLMLWALIIGISRVIAGVHYPTDIIGGIGSGLLASWLVWRQSGWLGNKLDKD